MERSVELFDEYFRLLQRHSMASNSPSSLDPPINGLKRSRSYFRCTEKLARTVALMHKGKNIAFGAGHEQRRSRLAPPRTCSCITLSIFCPNGVCVRLGGSGRIPFGVGAFGGA